MKKKTVAVFLSASDDVSPMFFSETQRLAQRLAAAKMTVVYGGARMGLMGCLAEHHLKGGGEIVGVIPEYFYKAGMVQPDLTETIVVAQLMDRKRKMAELADYVIACPGGIGTMDEVTEVLALKQVGEINKPVLFLNFLNFWDPLLNFMGEMWEQRMIRQPLDELFTVFSDSQEVVDFIASH